MSSVWGCVRLALAGRFSPGERLLIGVSGGADSVALLRACVDLRGDLGFEAHVLHVNHALRGAASDADAAWVLALCARLGVPASVETIDVAAQAAESRVGIEEAARAARHEAFLDVARRHGARVVAVAHTADDQAETVLHHIIRGTGLSGLRGMPAARPLAEEVVLVRPLLDVRRAKVLEWLAELGQDFRVDASNRDAAFTRNRIRHALLPLLERDFNPQATDALLRLSRQAREAEETLRALAAHALDRAVDAGAEATCRIDCRPLMDLPRHLVRECFVELWTRRGWPRQAMTADHWDRLAGLVLSDAACHGAVTLPGALSIRRDGDVVVVTT